MASAATDHYLPSRAYFESGIRSVMTLQLFSLAHSRLVGALANWRLSLERGVADEASALSCRRKREAEEPTNEGARTDYEL